MSLMGKKVLVAGASGEIGRGAAHALASVGASVTLAGRSRDKLEAVKESLPQPGNHSIIVGDYSTAQGVSDISSSLEVYDIVIASSGPWWPIYTLSEADPVTMEQATAANFQAHLNLYAILVPKFCKEKYFMVNGAASDGLPRTGLTGILANACVGAASVMHAECSNDSTKPDFLHVLISSSVGHSATRKETIDPNDYGRIFVAMALDKDANLVDEHGTVRMNDAAYEKLVAMI